ncbi:MAG: uncharacterized protein KVP18_000291 [Porospora cf. gigantea A]|nr:MAG: hypothetical protein KVP18_000291 [Porospora cf. gigantea A]
MSTSKAIRRVLLESLDFPGGSSPPNTLSPFEVKWRAGSSTPTLGDVLFSEVVLDEPTVGHLPVGQLMSFLQTCSLTRDRITCLTFSFLSQLRNSDLHALSKFPRLKRLAVDGCRFIDGDAFEESALLGLEGLRIFWIPKLTPEAFKRILSVIPMKQLRELSLVGCPGVDDGVLAVVCSRFRNLASMDLTRLDAVSEVGLSQVLETCTTLSFFRFYANQHVQHHGFKKLPNLALCQHLDLTGSRVRDDDLRRFLQAAKTLKSLNLTWAVESEGQFIHELSGCSDLRWLSLHGVRSVALEDLKLLRMPLRAVDFYGISPCLQPAEIKQLFPQAELTSLAH